MLGMFWESMRSNPGPLIGFLFTAGTLIFILVFAGRTDRPEVAQRHLLPEDHTSNPEKVITDTDSPEA